MRRGKQANAQSRRAINAFEHGACRAFAVRARDVDQTKFLLRIARERRELARVFQTELRAEPAQVVEESNGFGVVQTSELEFDDTLLWSLCLPALCLFREPLGILLGELERGIGADPVRGIVHAAPIREFQIPDLNWRRKCVGLFHTNRPCRISKRFHGCPGGSHPAGSLAPTVSHRRRLLQCGLRGRA